LVIRIWGERLMLPETFNDLIINDEDVILEDLGDETIITSSISKVESVLDTPEEELDEKWIFYKNKWRQEGRI
jgi:hypothetical protein